MEYEESSKVSALKRELEEKEKNLLLAAQIGKDLLEENSQLNSKLEEFAKDSGFKIEGLKQEIYTLTMKLEVKERVITNAQSELDQREKLHQKDLERMQFGHNQALEKQNKKISSQMNTIESLQNELQFSASQIAELQNALSESCDKLGKEISQTIPNHFEDELANQEIQKKQVLQLSTEKQALENEISSLTIQLNSCQHQLERTKAIQDALKTEIEEKECELTTLSNTLQKSKEENEELRVEIDNMKLQETDPCRKGNSIFSELEDNRKSLEKKLLSIMEKFEVSKKQCEIKTHQINQLKVQIGSLLLLNKTEMDQGYINHLEESLYEIQNQLKKYTQRCQELENVMQKEKKNEKIPACENGCNGIFKVLYHQTKDQKTKLEAELESVRFNKISLSDQLHQLKRKSYLLEREKDSLNGQLIQLKVKLQELQGQPADRGEEKQNPKPVKEKEILPFFVEKKSGYEKKEINSSLPLKLNSNRNDITTVNTKKELQNSLKDKENISVFPLSSSGESIKQGRVKKSVRLTDTVEMIEEGEKINTLSLKENDGGDKPKKLPKSLRKIDAPHIDARDFSTSQECNQQ